MTRTKPYGDRRQHLPPGTQPAALREPGLQLVVEHAACPWSNGVPPLCPRRRLLSGRRGCAVPRCTDVAGEGALAVKEEEEVLASKEQQLLVETERFARSCSQFSALARRSRCCYVVCGQRALAKMGDTARPGRDANTGRRDDG